MPPGHPQEQLAEREGKGQSWVGYRLCFGRFLSYSDTTTAVVNDGEKPVTELRFRSYWERTEKALDEGARVLLTKLASLIQVPCQQRSLADNVVNQAAGLKGSTGGGPRARVRVLLP